MEKTFHIGDYTFICEDVEADGWKGITVMKNGMEHPFYGFGGKGEANFRARCYEVYADLTRSTR